MFERRAGDGTATGSAGGAVSPDGTPPPDNFAPIAMECDAPHLPVTGEIPAGLRGTLFRNGPNPQFPPADPAAAHWFLGDGMVHAFTIADGRVAYRNRWVRTEKWRRENAVGHAIGRGFAGPPDPDGPRDGVANTSLAWHAGRLLALEEGHLPIELDRRSLETIGVQDFGGALHGPFTAHPKGDPATGELVFFGYSTDGPLTPGMRWGTIAADGQVTRQETFQAPYSAMVHDFAVTARHVVFPIMPLTGSMERAMSGRPPFAWDPSLGAHIGVMRRDAGVASLAWFRAETGYVFHVLNAWDEPDGRIVLDVMRYDAPPLFPNADGSPTGPRDARLTRWTLDPAAGTDAFRAETVDDMPGEFPRLDERRTGLRNRFGGFAGRSRTDGSLDTIVWLDLREGRRTAFTLPHGDASSEPVFVPRAPDAGEGEGWLLSVVWRAAERRSDLIILDTDGIDRGPLATVALSHRVPFGFHGAWVGGTS